MSRECLGDPPLVLYSYRTSRTVVAVVLLVAVHMGGEEERREEEEEEEEEEALNHTSKYAVV